MVVFTSTVSVVVPHLKMDDGQGEGQGQAQKKLTVIIIGLKDNRKC